MFILIILVQALSKGYLDGFEIAGSDKFFYPAQARIIENKIRVYSKKVRNPKYVRYGWKNYFEATFLTTKVCQPHHLKLLKIIFVDKLLQNQPPSDLQKNWDQLSLLDYLPLQYLI